MEGLGLSNKISSCEVSAWKINNTVEHDANSVLKGFENYYSTLAENLLNMLPKHALQIKQHSKVKYLGCLFDETMSGEVMPLNVVNKINKKLKFLYRKNSYLTPALRRLLCLVSKSNKEIKT